MQKNVILSGMQPTGALHLGNYLGALKQWVELQSKYDSIFCIVDYHAMTIEYDPKELPKRIRELALDWLAAGLNPEKSIIFIQSHVPEHTELAWVFNTITPIGELERMTQFKEKSGQHKKNINAGLFTYPILQAADILLYKGSLVPVGEDQVQHVELTRDVARKFNKTFGRLFPETKPILTKTARVMSPADPTKKMSKSLGEKHYIALTDDEGAIRKKIRSAVTDTNGNADSPGIRNLFAILEALDNSVAQGFQDEQKRGTLKYSDLKDVASNTIISHLKPFQERRRKLAQEPERVGEILIAGAKRARKIAQQTMDEVREKIGVR
ncbi:tryptophan--tRNA ligase [Candidatus Collierbacteria bacterium CG1_02_44_10]|uniref:Tryptophan--tRNA ligase n=1 Tax=Candidatus Collierbacteria bacterium CG1_02_44_10 TaxID=1805087 RepID=A0A1J4RYL3_9BACT|nr:MAG: tryptophan--tRNA ligase [Candidatus Collierbacteria bacterium CG1_02_44_10]